jgi:hypothetical protein
VGSNTEEEEEGFMPYSSNMPEPLSKQQVPILGKSLVQCIKHWQEGPSNLKRNRLFVTKGEGGGLEEIQ